MKHSTPRRSSRREFLARSSALGGRLNYERLLTLKQKHDRDNFFRRNANIAKSRQL
jgi:hypothetical protein